MGEKSEWGVGKGGWGMGRVAKLSGNRYSVLGIRVSIDDGPFPISNSQNI
jgi:hypothetical protein